MFSSQARAGAFDFNRLPILGSAICWCCGHYSGHLLLDKPADAEGSKMLVLRYPDRRFSHKIGRLRSQPGDGKDAAGRSGQRRPAACIDGCVSLTDECG